jgi:hypothetical protein
MAAQRQASVLPSSSTVLVAGQSFEASAELAYGCVVITFW